MSLLLGAHDFPYLFLDQAAQLLTLPLAWTPQSHDGLGVFTLSTLWTWPYGLIYGLAARVGIDFGWTTIVFGIVLTFILSWISMGALLSAFPLSISARRIGQLLFAVNTYILMLIDGGQLSLAVGYSLLPLAIYYLDSPIKFIWTVSTISFLDIRYIYVLALFLLPVTLFEKKRILFHLRTAFLTCITLASLHGYWLLPALLSRAPSLPVSYSRISQVDNLSFASISHVISFLHPHWPKNIFGQISKVRVEFLIFPALAFLPIIFYKRNKTIAFWSLNTLVLLFLIKGSNPPLPSVYLWLFTHVPGFSLFRDPTKFFPFLAICYSVLISYAIEILQARNNRIPVLFALFILTITVPSLLTESTGLFSLPRHAMEYQSLATFLSAKSTPGGIIWIPKKPPLGFGSPDHPSTDALTLAQKRPFATGVVGSYDTLNFLREASYSGQLLDISSVGYLGVAAVDPKRDSLKPEDVGYHHTFIDQLEALSWISGRVDFGEVVLLSTTSHQDTFFVPENTTFVVGSDLIYNTTPELANSAMIFAEEHPALLEQISRFPQANFLSTKKITDTAASFLSQKYMFFPASQLDFSPNETGWWKRDSSDLIRWRDFLQQKYRLDNQDFDFGGGWAVSEGEHDLRISKLSCKKDCVLLARVMFHSKGGDIIFTSNQVEIGKVSTQTYTSDKETFDQPEKYEEADFYWKEVGLAKNSKEIVIKSSGEINVLNAIALVPKDIWLSLQKKADQLHKIPIAPRSNKVEISYIKKNPAHFTVTIKGEDKPLTLAFAQNYDPLWQVAGQYSTPLYSLINGFSLPGTGVYDVAFTPQRYVIPGLFISIISLMTLVTVSYICKWR